MPDEQAARIMRERENPDAVETGKTPDFRPGGKSEMPAPGGKIKNVGDPGTPLGVYQPDPVHSASDSGYKNLPLADLPTRGIFYPDTWELTIKPATVNEIRHWSSMDRGDMLDMDEKMNFIVEKCVRIIEKGVPVDWRELKDIDRLFIIFRVQELTFPNDENKIMMKFICQNNNCPGDDTYVKREALSSDMLNIFELPDKLMKYFDHDKRVLRVESQKTQKTYNFAPPTIGASQRLKSYTQNKRENGEKIDRAFVRIAPYIMHDFRVMTDEYIDKQRALSTAWSKNEVLFFSWVAEQMEEGVKLTATTKCPRCSSAIVMPLFFRDGIQIKDLFSISDPTDGFI